MAKLTKQDIRNPDKFTKELQKSFTWTTQHSTLVAAVVAVVLLVGGGYSAYSAWTDHKEAEIQEQYFKIEKNYLEKKESFGAAESPTPAKSKVMPVKPSGDIEADYGSIIKDFRSLIEKYPSTKAAKMAALNLGEIYSNYGKNDEALDALTKVSTSTDLLSALVLTEVGTLQANKQDCKGALNSWDKVLANKNANFLAASLFLKQGLCHESLGNVAEAEASYLKAKESSREGATAKSAEKYLRLLKVKQN